MCGVKWAALVTGSVLLATAGYAIAGGTLRIIRLHSGQSVRIGTVKVIAVDKTRVVTKTVTSKPQTVTALTTVTATSTVAVTAPGTTITVPNTNTCTSSIPYPGDAGAPAAIAEWMARGARARRVPASSPSWRRSSSPASGTSSQATPTERATSACGSPSGMPASTPGFPTIPRFS